MTTLLNWLLRHREEAFLSLTAHLLLLLILSCILMGASSNSGIGITNTTVSFAGDDVLAETFELASDEMELIDEEVREEPDEPEQSIEEEVAETVPEEPVADDPEIVTQETNDFAATETSEGAGISAEEMHHRRQAAGGDSGAVFFTAAWEDSSDIDMHVTDSRGEKVFYRHKRGRLGTLDVDANAGTSSFFSRQRLTSQPVENYVQQSAELGLYFITINLFQKRVAGSVPYTLGTWIDGQQRLFQGVLDSSHRSDTYSFEIKKDGSVVWLSTSEYRHRINTAEAVGAKSFAQARYEFRRGQTQKSKELLLQLIAETPAACAISRKARLALEEAEQVLSRRQRRLR